MKLRDFNKRGAIDRARDVSEPGYMSRPSGKIPSSRNAYVDGIQTGESGIIADTAVMRVRQTPYGMTNGEVHLETFSFAAVDGPEALDAMEPLTRMTLDTVGARKLINELSLTFGLDTTVKPKQRMGGIH